MGWGTILGLSGILAFNASGVAAQTGGASPSRGVGSTSGARAELPPAVQPVLSRIGTLQRFAQTRLRDAPNEARSSYRAAESAFRSLAGMAGTGLSQSLAVGNAAATGSNNIAAGATDNGDGPSVTQVTADIRALRVASRDAEQAGRTAEAARLRRMAEQYASGAKELFTGQLREALFAPAGGASVIIDNGSGPVGGRPTPPPPAAPPPGVPAPDTAPPGDDPNAPPAPGPDDPNAPPTDPNAPPAPGDPNAPPAPVPGDGDPNAPPAPGPGDPNAPPTPMPGDPNAPPAPDPGDPNAPQEPPAPGPDDPNAPPTDPNAPPAPGDPNAPPEPGPAPPGIPGS